MVIVIGCGIHPLSGAWEIDLIVHFRLCLQPCSCYFLQENASRIAQSGYYMSAQVSAPDDRANAMVVNAGLADSSKWDAIYENVLTKKTYPSCFFDRWVFEALCAMGKQEYALLRMYSRYKTMIPCNFTTLWEHYDRWWASHIDAYDDASSLNHGWNPLALFLSQSIAGISPEAAGWSTYHVLPQEAFLTSIKCVVSSIKGKIALEMRKTASEYSIRLTSPANTKAIVGVPKGSFSKLTTIEVDGTTIWDGAYKGGVTQQFSFWRCARWLGRLGFASWRGRGGR